MNGSHGMAACLHVPFPEGEEKEAEKYACLEALLSPRCEPSSPAIVLWRPS